MKDKIENLKRELREFLELSKTITQEKWTSNDNKVVELFRGHLQNQLFTTEDDNLATFIARSRNISPALAECLLGAVDTALDCESWDAELHQMYLRPDAERILQQILGIWEASK
jgi:hypothetical protein